LVFLEQAISALKLEAREAKRAYETAVAERSACQRQLNDLHERKSSWSEADVGRFTALIRQDHINQQEEARAKERADATELLVESEFSELMRSILNRYHEEQVWSDKIRSASTYGSLAALGLNLIVFILAIVVVEPWKRKRLGETFEQRIVLMEKENQELVREGLKTLSAHFERQEEILTQLAAITHNPSTHEPSPHETSPPESTTNTAADRLSHILPSDPNTRIMTIVAGAVTFSTAVLMYLIRR
jgi:sensitive to high expression protein 9, mitochondrial